MKADKSNLNNFHTQGRSEEQNIITITLPDLKTKQFKSGISGSEILSTLGKSLEKNAVAALVNDKIVDLSEPIFNDAKFSILTRESKEGLEIIRHDTAHILAQAVKELYPEAKIAIGPTIKDGFYYDIDCPQTISESDLEKIESKMLDIVKEKHAFVRSILSKEECLKLFSDMGEDYKVEIVENIPADEKISIYHQGDFLDLCSGPHGVSTKGAKHFKLLSVSGAYWRGDSSKKMLQRIYGTAWATKEELDSYINRIKEAKARDHRQIGKDMELFHLQGEAQGSVFWHSKGLKLFQTLISYLREKQEANGYVEIATPEVMNVSLWEASGHWDKFKDNMLISQIDKNNSYAFRPMNCPGCLQVIKSQGALSYRDLPMRVAEFGKVFRNEASGALYGLMRARSFTQDDAHIFCTFEDLESEVQAVCKLVLETYKDFGFKDCSIKFADRPENRIGSDEVWDRAEDSLLTSIKNLGVKYEINKAEGAFYGPKIEFHLEDSMGREWQLGTVQLDLNMPARLGATYVNKEGEKDYPVMIHRAIFGSLERFIAILLENYAGRLPMWLSPNQVTIISINERNNQYAEEVQKYLKASGINSYLDTDRDTMKYKIRKHTLKKASTLLIIGDDEEAEKSVSIRWHGDKLQKYQSKMQINDFANTIKGIIAEKSDI